MKRTPNYPIVDGKVVTRSIEIHIVDHCNLRCKNCCSLSPFLPQHTVSPSQLLKDLRLASRLISPTWLKLVGGEPLMHPQLLECLRAARRANVGTVLSVTTNGFLLPKMAPEFWRLVDALTISIYPDPKLPENKLRLIHDKAAACDVTVNLKEQHDFVDINRTDRRKDEAETQRIFESCWLRERCHILSNGFLYTCTRPPHTQSLFHAKENFEADGIRLHEELSPEALRAYLMRHNKLAACAWCNGGHATTMPHRQLTRDEVKQKLVAIR